jgi:hypothetical protein
VCPSICLEPGSHCNSISAHSQVLSGIKKHVKVPLTREAPLDSPPSTPPALELACVLHVYSTSESSPPLSALLYPSAQEYLKPDYQDGPTPLHYFDPHGSPRHPAEAGHLSVPKQLQLQLLAPPPCPSTVMGGLHCDSCDNASGSEHGPYCCAQVMSKLGRGLLCLQSAQALVVMFCRDLSHTCLHLALLCICDMCALDATDRDALTAWRG